MSVTITNKNKNDLTVTNQGKSSSGTFDQGVRTFADGGSYGEPGVFILKDSKNNISISNETKS